MSEENVYLNELGEPVAIPPSHVEDPASPVRLCEYDVGAQSGCRRTQIILALEAEFDTFAHPEMEWGFADQLCRHEGFIYYNKAKLTWLFNDDARVKAEDAENGLHENPDWITSRGYTDSYAGYRLIENEAPNWHNTFDVKPAGFPTVTIETPQFYQCEDILAGELVTAENITKEKLNIIQSSFTSDWHPLTNNLTNSLYILDGKAYCVDALSFENHPAIKLGVSLTNAEGNVVFFAFSTLTTEQVNFVNGATWSDATKEAEIVYL
jgi:hypothetical protein